MNTQTDIQLDTSKAPSRTGGPGSQLRQARLDLKLQPEDVAHILHLSPRQIVALESDDYDSLPQPTYVRGYLRGYAQLLGLPADPIVESYNRLVVAKKPVDLGKLTPTPELGSDHQLIKFATIAVVAIVLGLSALWWREQKTPTPPPREVSTQLSPTETLPPAEEPATSTTDTNEVMPPSETPAPVKVPAGPEPRAAMTPAPVANPITSAAPPPGVTAVGPRGRVVLKAQADSWADVRDGNGSRLVYEMLQTGRSVTVEGTTPISVFLGNADGVQVEFNGQTYDVSRHRRGEVARFTLGEPARAQ